MNKISEADIPCPSNRQVCDKHHVRVWATKCDAVSFCPCLDTHTCNPCGMLQESLGHQEKKQSPQLPASKAKVSWLAL